MWHWTDTVRNYKTSENKDQDSFPVWAITAVFNVQQEDVLTGYLTETHSLWSTKHLTGAG